MNRELFSEECEVAQAARVFLESNKEISCADYAYLLVAYEKLLNQTMHITNISDMLSKNLNQYKHDLLNKVNVDELTNVGNRRHLLALLERYCGECGRTGNWISAIMIDIDYFKNYNDLYGHISGDNCLKKVAAAVSNSVRRPSDFVARYGGEEFYVVLPYTPINGAKKVADRIMQNIAALKIPHGDSQADAYLTVSIGLTSVIPAADTKVVNLLTICDTALYQAKAAGRNCIVMQKLAEPCSAAIQAIANRKEMKKNDEL